jgi:hypothetical protein
VHIRERIEPQAPAQAAYARQYPIYRTVYQALLPAFEQSARNGG